MNEQILRNFERSAGTSYRWECRAIHALVAEIRRLNALHASTHDAKPETPVVSALPVSHKGDETLSDTQGKR